MLWCLRGDESEPPALFSLFYTILKKYLLIRLYNTMKNANINMAGWHLFCFQKRS